MAYIADIVSGGIDPLQDTDRDMNVAHRSVRMGCRVIDRAPDGDLIIDRESIGDQIGWVLWHQIQGARDCPAYAQAWPARVVNTTGGTGTSDGIAVLPMGERGVYDARFGVKIPTVARVGSGQGRLAWGRSPRGQVGIILSTTDEYNPSEVFMPTDPRLIAPNAGGDGAMGSVVVDLSADNTYDPSRYARLQTMMRVVPLGTAQVPGVVPDTMTRSDNMGCLAWNLALTGRESAFGRGMVIDNASGARPPDRPPSPGETFGYDPFGTGGGPPPPGAGGGGGGGK